MKRLTSCMHFKFTKPLIFLVICLVPFQGKSLAEQTILEKSFTEALIKLERVTEDAQDARDQAISMLKSLSNQRENKTIAEAALQQLGQIFLLRGDSEKSEFFLARLCSEFPNSDRIPVAFLTRGHIARSRYVFHDAILLYLKAIEILDSDDPCDDVRITALSAIIICYEKLGDDGGAKKYRDLLRKDCS